ncbi:NAD(P)H-dependent oxidoreductase [Alphaproteobacteria bacterium LSUCC0396]
MSKTLLIIAHTPSPNTAALAKAGIAACRGYDDDDDNSDVETRCLSPFDVTSTDLATADGVIIGTTENIGYMAGATKDMFDRCYNDWLDRTNGKPVAIYIRAGLDGTATKRALTSISGALGWRLVADVLILHGDWNEGFCQEVANLCLGMAAGLDAGIF